MCLKRFKIGKASQLIVISVVINIRVTIASAHRKCRLPELLVEGDKGGLLHVTKYLGCGFV